MSPRLRRGIQPRLSNATPVVDGVARFACHPAAGASSMTTLAPPDTMCLPLRVCSAPIYSEAVAPG